MEVTANSLCLRSRDNRRQSRGVGLLYRLNAAEVFQESASGSLSDARNFEEFCGAVAHLAALAVKSYSETVRLVANELDQVQDR